MGPSRWDGIGCGLGPPLWAQEPVDAAEWLPGNDAVGPAPLRRRGGASRRAGRQAPARAPRLWSPVSVSPVLWWVRLSPASLHPCACPGKC